MSVKRKQGNLYTVLEKWEKGAKQKIDKYLKCWKEMIEGCEKGEKV